MVLLPGVVARKYTIRQNQSSYSDRDVYPENPPPREVGDYCTANYYSKDGT